MSALEIQAPGTADPIVKQEDLDDEDEGEDAASNFKSDHESTDEDSPLPTKSHNGGNSYRSNVGELQKYPPLLLSTLFSYMAIVILKVPLTLNEIFRYDLERVALICRWIKEDKIPYYHGHKVVPSQMLRRLHGHTRFRLTVNTKFQAKTLHLWIRPLAQFYQLHFRMTPPCVNYRPILYKYLAALAFPIELFGIAQRLAEELALDFSIAGGGKGVGSPDAQLVSLLIIAAKLGFDLERKAEWINWATATDEEDVCDQQGELEDLTENDILTMKDEKLDEYMEWIETKWLDNNPESGGLDHPKYQGISNCVARRRTPETILSMFPLQPHVSRDHTAPSTRQLSFLPLVPRPGAHNKSYQIYQSEIGPPVFRRMIQRASFITGLDESTLRLSLRTLELRLRRNIEP